LVSSRVAGDAREYEAAAAVVGKPAVDVLDEVGENRRVPGLLEDQ
jgi:hypothetical protein